MEIKNNIKKAAIASLAVGALIVTGLTAGVASADGGMGVPEASGPSFIPGALPPVHRPIFSPVNYVNPVYYNYNYVRPVNYVYPVNFYNNTYYNLYNYAFAQGNNLWVSNTAEVLNIPTAVVIAELNQNKTLTQIAAERGIGRPFFVMSLTSHAQADVVYASTHGTINGIYAANLISSIPAQANFVVDRPGLR